MISRREARRRLLVPGDLRGLITLFMDKKLLLKVTASPDQLRFEPATWCVRRDFRATMFGKKLEYHSFKIAGWKHRDYTDEEWQYLEDLYEWGNREGETSLRPNRDRGINVLDWPIIMNRGDQRFPEAFDLVVARLGPKKQRISVSEFSRLKKQALRDVRDEQRKDGRVDPELESATHWSM